MSKKRLIVNADDFGLHEDVNYGIVLAHRNGIVKSTSLMVNMPAARHAVQLTLNCPELEIGLHLNISEGLCVAPAETVSLLADKQGQFLFDSRNMGHSLQCFSTLIEQQPKILDQIAIEFKAQINLFQSLGLRLTHINVHQYLALVHPQIFELYVLLADAVGVAYRGLCFPMVDLLNLSPSHITQITKIISRSCTPTPDLSISNLFDASTTCPTTDEYQRIMEAEISKLARQDHSMDVEIITHPAMLGEFLQCNDNYAWARKVETAMINNMDFRLLIEDLGYEIGGYQMMAI